MSTDRKFHCCPNHLEYQRIFKRPFVKLKLWNAMHTSLITEYSKFSCKFIVIIIGYLVHQKYTFTNCHSILYPYFVSIFGINFFLQIFTVFLIFFFIMFIIFFKQWYIWCTQILIEILNSRTEFIFLEKPYIIDENRLCFPFPRKKVTQCINIICNPSILICPNWKFEWKIKKTKHGNSHA